MKFNRLAATCATAVMAASATLVVAAPAAHAASCVLSQDYYKRWGAYACDGVNYEFRVKVVCDSNTLGRVTVYGPWKTSGQRSWVECPGTPYYNRYVVSVASQTR